MGRCPDYLPGDFGADLDNDNYSSDASKQEHQEQVALTILEQLEDNDHYGDIAAVYTDLPDLEAEFSIPVLPASLPETAMK
ncbi:hypothetical protein FSHL1_002511 [Fusarium sambucinum]